MKTVLVADDKAPGRELLRTILEQSGHRVFEASDGIEALRNAREIVPDLIILDLHMPLLDGFGVLKELKQTRGSLRHRSSPLPQVRCKATVSGHYPRVSPLTSPNP
jgi:CheY-like chemotaxis protein